MCGIAGFRIGERHCDRRADLASAVHALRHRGPDDEGLWFGEGVGLGHRRLSILDLSTGSRQPMLSPDGRYVMVYNGEVYNFRDVRRRLEVKGRSFATTGDSEVVLAAVDEWGVEAAVRSFIGMFAIAIWDNHERRLLLIRDRLGVKPLYYGWDGRSLWFGSELKALRAFRHWTPEIDRTALAEYFHFGYINAPRSIYRHVFKLEPGHWLELKDGAEPVIRCYWNVLDALDNPAPGNEQQMTEELEALMVDAFRLRMVSDVPVGMFLSGGIDSSVVTALLQKHHGDVHTFTIGFEEKQYDESAHARLVASHLGTHHTERTLETSEAKRILPSWAELYDEPFADASGIPTYLVSKLAAETVKVVLSADGGDELFSGYGIYTSMLRTLNRRNRIPLPIRALGGAVLRSLPLDQLDSWSAARFPTLQRVHPRRRPMWRLCRVRDWLGSASNGEVYERMLGASWWGGDAATLVSGPRPARALADTYPGTFADQMCLWDLHNYLPGDILTKVDRATMAVGIEGREPLIDHRLVEFAFRTPVDMRRGSLGTKHLLRKLLYKYVPRELVDRPKMGFAIPLGDWLHGDLHHLIDDYLDPALIRKRGMLNPDAVERATRAFHAHDDLATNKVWSMLAFQMWYERWA
ncbi:MAG TPA: asparagine synthase (glutamine-hydrolyzing) [Vicinamibacterales bacterium]|nr:asparagine synthase (glutamine-hydrolyzing) [Vicinamibacterales bacterium]